MSKQWGPLLTYDVILGSIGFAFAAAMCWAGSHQAWLIINNKAPSWMCDSQSVERFKPYHIYLYRVMAWIINIFWGWTMLRQPACGIRVVDQPCDPIFSNVALLDIGGIVFELVVFLVLTSIYRWLTGREPE